MLRFYYVIFSCTFLIIYYVPKMIIWSRNLSEHPEDERYAVTQKMINHIKKKGRIKTNVYGTDNLPENGGYIMYSNHQGKYDALGIMHSHEKPCSVLMEEKRSRMPIANQFIDFIGAKRLNQQDLRQQISFFNEISKEVKDGRKFIIFPEGKYSDNRNSLQEFYNGCFKCALKSESPIVPVMIYDSYKPFSINSLRKVTTEVHFLEPIMYDEFRDMKTPELCSLVKLRIEEAMTKRAADQ